MEASQNVIRQLSQSTQAVQKRKTRVVQREKRRRSFFMHDYVRTKYPGIFNEANAMYQRFVDKYPTKPDFCKTYYFRKWQKRIDDGRACLMVPHLPVQLMSAESLQQYRSNPTTSDEQVNEQPSDQINEQVGEEVSEEVVEEVSVQVSEEVVDEGIQNNRQDDKQDQINTQFTQVSIEEIDRAVEQIVQNLQTDDQLCNIMSGVEFDLPDDVWEKELALPDYVLENELEW